MDEEQQESMHKEKMNEYLGDLKTSIDSGKIDSMFCVAQRGDGSYETAIIGTFDPFSLLGFTLFVQFKKLLQLMPDGEDVLKQMQEQARLIQ